MEDISPDMKEGMYIGNSDSIYEPTHASVDPLFPEYKKHTPVRPSTDINKHALVSKPSIIIQI